MLSNWISSFLKYYSLFGFHSCCLARIGGKLIADCIFFIQFGLCIWCTILAFKKFDEDKRNMEFLDALNFFGFYLTSCLTYWLIIYDTYKNRRIGNAFWQRFIRINAEFIIHIDVDKWDFFGGFIAMGVIDLALLMITILRTLNNSSDYVFHYNFIVIFDQRIFFYLLHVKAVTLQMRKLLYIIKNQRNANPMIFGDYHLIYEMINDMNKAFGWSNLGLTLFNFHASVTFANFIYRQRHNRFYKLNAGSILIHFFFFLDMILL